MTRKIIVVLFALMFGISLVTPQADAVNHCIGSFCPICNWAMFPISDSVPAVDFSGQTCDSSFAASPCTLNNHPDSNSKIFTVTSIKQERQKTGGPITFADSGTPLLQNVIGSGKRGLFQVTSDTIPIYLQNLSLLC